MTFIGTSPPTAGGGSGPCVGVVPLAFGAGRVASNTVTRYLQPPGEYVGSNVADNNPIPYRMQATGSALRLEIRVRSGAGNGNPIDYELMLLVAGVPTALPSPMVVTLASTFSGVASIVVAGGNPLADGDELVLEVRKANGVGTSPMDVQAFVQIEQDCGGAAGVACCAPSYLNRDAWNHAEIYTTGDANVSVDLDASTCGQTEPLTGTIRASLLFPVGTPPVITAVLYDGVNNLLRVLVDASGATDGNYILEITNDCGCCWLLPMTGVSV